MITSVVAFLKPCTSVVSVLKKCHQDILTVSGKMAFSLSHGIGQSGREKWVQVLRDTCIKTCSFTLITAMISMKCLGHVHYHCISTK